MNKKDYILAFICLIICSGILFMGYKKADAPQELYRVYLQGKTIGYIRNKQLLEEYIDNEQYELKEKYNVDKVYLPNDLDIVKEITYNQDVLTEEEIYNKIKDISPFTINGYTITIKGFEVQQNEEEATMIPDYKIYVIDRETFEKSIKNTVQVFVPEKDYENFINKTQTEINDVGSIIEDIYIKNEITITEGRISTTERIFTDVEELNKYMLFGTTEEQEKYTVQSGDLIADIAYKNKLSVQEFLIANPEFTSENNLLYEGQVVNLGMINPLFKLIEEDHVVELQPESFGTKIEYDESMVVGYEKVKQEGENGILKVTKKVQKLNGEIQSAVITKTETIKPAVPKIIVKGSKVIPTVGDVGVWAWPTAQPYIISSPYGWRWGKLHQGIDIAGTGCNSPIYSTNNGVVVVSGYTSVNGNYIYIDHNNGYYSVYAHLATRNVEKGQAVSMGEKIGTMGRTGLASGCHLHYSVSRGYPYVGGVFLNPMQFYK